MPSLACYGRCGASGEGESVNARFQPLEEVEAMRQGDLLIFQLDDVEARGVVLITSKPQRERARQLLTSAIE